MIEKNIPTPRNWTDSLLTAVLVLVIAIAILVTLFVVISPKENEHFTEFFILGENRTADRYPDQIVPGLTYPMYIGVGNHESRNTTYEIEVWVLDTEFDNTTNTHRILGMDPNDRMSLTLAHNETVIIPYNLSIMKTGYNRVEFLLFKDGISGDEVTGSDRINASYRNLDLWVSVS